MSDNRLVLAVQIELDPGADAAELEEHTLQLRSELRELDVDDVERRSTSALPEGAKGVDAALVGTLIITAGREAISAVVRTVAGWVSRSGGRAVKIQLGDDVLELSNASREEQRRVVDAFVDRHGPTDGS